MNTTRKFQGLAVAVLILATATAFVLPDRGNRANDAWTGRLNGQAAQEQEQARIQRARDAYSARMEGQTTSFETFIAKKEAARLERANKAWSDRLTGLAEAEAAAK